MSGNQFEPPPEPQERNLLDYWGVVVRWRRLVLLGSGSSVLLVLIYCALSPKVFESTSSIVAPKESTAPSLYTTISSSGLLQSVPGLSMPSLTPTRDLFVSVLKSRTMAEAVVEQCRLAAHFGIETIQAATRLRRMTSISVSKEGLISVTAESTDPKLAAEIANAYMTNLNGLLARLGTTEASRERGFISRRLSETEKTLTAAEEALRSFQERHQMVALEDQARATVDAAARLKGEIITAEVQLSVLKDFVNAENTEVIRLERQIEEMRRQLGELLEKSESELSAPPDLAEESIPVGMAVPLADYPSLRMQLGRLAREVKVQETVYTLLTERLEQTKINEARDLPTVQILDHAIPAPQRSRPRTARNVLLVGFAGFVGFVLLAFLLEYVQDLKRKVPHSAAAGRADTAERGRRKARRKRQDVTA